MTVRDWLQLLIVPFALVAIGFLFTMQQEARQQAIEDQRARAERELQEQRAQDEALEAYLQQMGQLILERNLLEAEKMTPCMRWHMHAPEQYSLGVGILSVGRVPGCGCTCGAISLSDGFIVHYRLAFVYILSKIICKLANKDRRRRMHTDVKIDGAKVRVAREQRFLSQRELADKAQMNHNTVWRIESTGLADVHPRTIRKLAEALSVDPASLTPKE